MWGESKKSSGIYDEWQKNGSQATTETELGEY